MMEKGVVRRIDRSLEEDIKFMKKKLMIEDDEEITFRKASKKVSDMFRERLKPKINTSRVFDMK